MGWKGKYVFQITATKTVHARVLVPMCVSAHSNTCVYKCAACTWQRLCVM